MNLKKAGIYCIKNLRDDKVYVGRSVDIERRLAQHRRSLQLGKSTHHLQNAWNKYGSDAFEFTVLEYCDPTETVLKEAQWIKALSACLRTSGYNLNEESGDGSFTQSHETRQKRSTIMKLKALSPIWRELNRQRVFKMIEEGRWSTLKTRSAEQRDRWLATQRTDQIRQLRSDNAKKQGLGKDPWDDEKRQEWRAKFSGEGNPCYGKPLPQERKQKISESLLGKPSPKPPGFGAKIAEARRQYWAQKRAAKEVPANPCEDEDM